MDAGTKLLNELLLKAEDEPATITDLTELI